MTALARDRRVLRAKLASRRRHYPNEDHSELLGAVQFARTVSLVKEYLDSQPGPTVEQRQQLVQVVLDDDGAHEAGRPGDGAPHPNQASYDLCPERTGSHDVAAVPRQREATA